MEAHRLINTIRAHQKHEATITSRGSFSTYLKTVQFNAEPVLLFHQRHEELCGLLEAISTHRPEYEFTSTEK
ncbi:MAG: hypothetical protein IPG07_19365 [Crocinitomicaceae bacterium]|nr:hypothetical protein [Crocinitomicaceae bacterium]